MELGVLGRLQVTRDGAELDLGTRKQRILLAGLALRPNQVVSADALVDLVWPTDPPPAVTASLHGYVAALRRVLEPDRGARNRPQILLTRPPGYELHVPAEWLDAARFTRAVETVHERLAGAEAFDVPAGLTSADLAQLAADLTAALALWRGSPYAELPDDPAATAERTRLAELRLLAVQDRARVQLALGRTAAVAADLATATQHHPLQEDLWGLRALALARDGRQADALATLRSARAVLDEELGIDPGPRLQQLEVAILRQDAGLRRPPPAAERGAERSEANRPLIGRRAEMEALAAQLGAARSGVPQLALLVGEPGIGKTRLTQELAARATAEGFTVLVGRCSEDEGAPPLWPWIGLLRALRAAWPQPVLPELDSLGSADRFRTFDAVVRLLLEHASEHPLVLVFDDLHWADASSLRLLRHLVENADRGRLLVVATRRAHPEPQGALAELGATLARHRTLRLELRGLAVDGVTALATAETGQPPEPAVAVDLQERTGGNPFFIVEVLQLAGDQQGALDRASVPAAVGDVIAARIGQLPSRTQHLLRSAAVLGRTLDLGVLARLEGDREEKLLDELEPAIIAGTVTETVHGELQFSHALVRDAIYSAISPLRRQRQHAELAHVLEASDRPHHPLSEIARHWLAAGRGHAARAWQAAAEAAAYASQLQAHDEAAELLAAAVAAQEQDPGASAIERYDLLMARALAYRASANSDGQRTATAAAIRLAQQAGDVERVAMAAITSSEGALWSNRPQGVVDVPTVEALNLAVRELPNGDSALRCRVFLALSRELFWSTHPQEGEAHAELGLAMARRLDDPQLRSWAAHTAYVGAFRPDTLTARLDLAAESVGCSRAAGDEEGEATGLLWLAIASGEAGRLDDRQAAVDRALALAERRRLRYLQVMLGSYQAPWLALAGQFAEAERLYADMVRWGEHATFPFRDEAIAAARLCLDLWRGGAAELLPGLRAIAAHSPVDLNQAILLLLLRSAPPVEIAQHLDRAPLSLRADTFESPLNLALAAEAAFVLGRPEPAAQVYPLLAPWAGRFASAGTGTPLGPVDAFLALAAAAVGELALAARHADEAHRLCTRWQLTPVAGWLAEHRRRGGF